jgi:hypothetical protein
MMGIFILRVIKWAPLDTLDWSVINSYDISSVG